MDNLYATYVNYGHVEHQEDFNYDGVCSVRETGHDSDYVYYSIDKPQYNDILHQTIEKIEFEYVGEMRGHDINDPLNASIASFRAEVKELVSMFGDIDDLEDLNSLLDKVMKVAIDHLKKSRYRFYGGRSYVTVSRPHRIYFEKLTFVD